MSPLQNGIHDILGPLWAENDGGATSEPDRMGSCNVINLEAISGEIRNKVAGWSVIRNAPHMETNWTLRLIQLLDTFGKLPNASPEGGVRPGGGTMADRRSEWAGPRDFEESLSGGNGVIGHDETSRGSLESKDTGMGAIDRRLGKR